jgi:hypothetical protein
LGQALGALNPTRRLTLSTFFDFDSTQVFESLTRRRRRLTCPIKANAHRLNPTPFCCSKKLFDCSTPDGPDSSSPTRQLAHRPAPLVRRRPKTTSMLRGRCSISRARCTRRKWTGTTKCCSKRPIHSSCWVMYFSKQVHSTYNQPLSFYPPFLFSLHMPTLRPFFDRLPEKFDQVITDYTSGLALKRGCCRYRLAPRRGAVQVEHRA